MIRRGQNRDRTAGPELVNPAPRAPSDRDPAGVAQRRVPRHPMPTVTSIPATRAGPRWCSTQAEAEHDRDRRRSARILTQVNRIVPRVPGRPDAVPGYCDG